MIHLDFDELKILSATPNEAILLCHLFSDADPRPDDDSEPEPCVVIISRTLFQEALTAWLDAKASYLETYDHFAGVGYVALTGATTNGNTNVVDRMGDLIPVGVYTGVTSFEVDMEHG
jgi:hypothetical protein